MHTRLSCLLLSGLLLTGCTISGMTNLGQQSYEDGTEVHWTQVKSRGGVGPRVTLLEKTECRMVPVLENRKRPCAHQPPRQGCKKPGCPHNAPHMCTHTVQVDTTRKCRVAGIFDSSGPGIFNTMTSGLASAAVTAAGHVGFARLLRPPTHDETTNVSNNGGTVSATGGAAAADGGAGGDGGLGGAGGLGGEGGAGGVGRGGDATAEGGTGGQGGAGGVGRGGEATATAEGTSTGPGHRGGNGHHAEHWGSGSRGHGGRRR